MSCRIRAALAAMCILSLFAINAVAGQSPASTIQAIGAPSLRGLPMAFEQNAGQFSSEVKFFSRGPGYHVFLTPKEAVMVLEGGKEAHAPEDLAARAASDRFASILRMRFEGASESPLIRGESVLPHTTNYLVSGEPGRNIAGVASHARVKYESIYPGIDLVYYSNQGRLEYDLLLSPGADPERIKIAFPGAKKVSVADDGELVIGMPNGDIRYHKPVAYQELGGQRASVDAKYAIADGKVAFQVGAYDATRPLVIDPILSYSSYLWGSPTGIALDSAGNAYITGFISTTDLPASGTYQTNLSGSVDAYVAKLSPSGNTLIYATYIGARRATTRANSIAVDSYGNAYIAGTTDSRSYPVTSGAYQTNFQTGASFISKLNSLGTAFVYSTFVNGATIQAIALDASGNVYATGSATSLNTTPGAFQTSRPSTTYSPFVAKLNAAGSAMAYATYVGGSGSDTANSIAVDPNGSAYIAGTAYSLNFPQLNPLPVSVPQISGKSNVFVARLNAAGSALIYSTYLGGSQNDDGHGIALDPAGHAVVVGQTRSEDFPRANGGGSSMFTGYNYPNGFVSKISADGSTLAYSSIIGGWWCKGWGEYYCDGWSMGAGDAITKVAVDGAGWIYLGGYFSSFMPRSSNYWLLESHAPTNTSMALRAPWVMKMFIGDPAIAPTTPIAGGHYAGVIGERELENEVRGLAVDASGNLFAVAHSPYQPAFPITAGALRTSGGPATVVKLGDGRQPMRIVFGSYHYNGPTSADWVLYDVMFASDKTGGTMTYYANGTPIGTVPVAYWSARLSARLPAGIYKITAVYSEDGQTSAPLMVTVREP